MVQLANISLSTELEVSILHSFHYFEFAKNFLFEGERHNCWELVYVDSGELEATAERNGYQLRQGDIIFHCPNEFHNLWANNRVASNAVIITFQCLSPAMRFFEKKMFHLGDYDRNLLTAVVKHGFQAFEPPYDNLHRHELIRKKDAAFASEQLLRMNLEMLLLSIISQNYKDTSGKRLSSTARERSDHEMVQRLIRYMNDEIASNLTMEQMCDRFHISKTLIIQLFKDQTGTSAIKYYKDLKIEKVKTLIREHHHNFTEISEILGYPSIHSLSRHFKHATGMTLSDYSRSIKARF